MDYEDRANLFLEIVGLIIVLLIIVGVPLALGSIKYSSTREGQHTGYVTAVQENGIFFRNYKVYFKTDNQSSQEDIYCVHNSEKELLEKVRQANKERNLVTINYDGSRGIGLGLCEGEKITGLEK